MSDSSSDSSIVSSRKLRANRRNARQSTGPRTDAGKARSSRNAIAHGLFCKSLILPGEDADYFRDFQCDMLKSLNPRDAMELSFVQQIISAAWRIKRVPAAEAKVFAMQQQELHQKLLDECKKREEALTQKLKAARHADRAAIQAELDKFRQQIQDNRPDHSAGELLAMMLSHRESPASLALERLHRHEQRLAGTVTRGLKQLRDLRERRSEDEPTEFTRAMLEDAGDESVQNEATDEPDDDKSSDKNELATNEAPSSADERRENEQDEGDMDFQSMPEASKEASNRGVDGQSTG